VSEKFKAFNLYPLSFSRGKGFDTPSPVREGRDGGQKIIERIKINILNCYLYQEVLR